MMRIIVQQRKEIKRLQDDKVGLVAEMGKSQHTDIERLREDKVALTKSMGDIQHKLHTDELNAFVAEEKYQALVEFLKEDPVGKTINFKSFLY